MRNGAGPEWNHSSWTRLRIVQASAYKVHVDTRFTRYRKDGSVINSFDSLYVITKEQGRWGAKLGARREQMFAGGLKTGEAAYI